MTCAEVRSLIGGYVLQALEPREADTVRAHIATCPDCAREHAELAHIPAVLDAAPDPELPPAVPPPALEDAVVAGFALDRLPQKRRPRAPRWLTRPLPAAGAAAAAAVVITLALTALLGGSGDSGPKAYGAHLHNPPGAPHAYAYAHLSSFDAGTRVSLRVSGLHARPGVVYELWCVYPNGVKVSAGTFRVDASGRAEATMTTAARIGDYERLTVERHAPGKPGQRVLAGSISY
jgi:anti-sigma-K factor RskA